MISFAILGFLFTFASNIKYELMKQRFLLFIAVIMMTMVAFAQDGNYTSENYRNFKLEMSNGNLDKANKVLKKWEKKSPNDPELYCSYATLFYLMSSKHIQESDDLLAVKESAMLPDTISMFQNLKCKNYRIMKDSGNGMEHYNKSIEWINRCVNEYPDIMEAYINYMDILNRKKEYKYSTKVAFLFLDRSVKNGGMWLDYSLKSIGAVPITSIMNQQTKALMEAAEYELAERLIDHAIELYPQMANLKVLKAILYENLLQKDKAFELYEQAYASDSTDTEVIGNMALAYARNKNTKRALYLASKLHNCGNKRMEDLAKEIEQKYSDIIYIDGRKVDRSRYNHFNELIQDIYIDTLEIEKILTEWEKAEPNDADMQKCRIIYHTQLGKAELIKVKESQDQETINKLESMGLGKVTVRNFKAGDEALTGDVNFKKAINWAKKCLENNPDRIDIYILLLETAKEFRDEATIYDISLVELERTKIKNHKWLMAFNAPIPDAAPSDDQIFTAPLETLSEMGSTDLAKNLLKKLHKYFPGSKILKQWDELLK